MPASRNNSVRALPARETQHSAARTDPAARRPARRGRGRPRSDDSRDTRGEVIDAARVLFSEVGYDGTTLTAVAKAAAVSPTAVYHYFEDKEALYRAVFEATAPLVWPSVTSAIAASRTLADAIGRTASNWAALEDRCPGLTPFMAAVPREARLRPEFVPLLERRSAWQDEAFHALAAFGRSTGELAALSATDAFEFLRATVMGWVFEGNNRRRQFSEVPEALQHVIGLLATCAPARPDDGAALADASLVGER